MTNFESRGKKPYEDHVQTAKMLGLLGNATLPPGWFETNMSYDPIKLASATSYTIIALLGLQIFLYSKRDKLLRFKNKWSKLFVNNELIQPTVTVAVPSDVNENVGTKNKRFLEHKSLIFGAGQTLVVTGISVAFFLPIAVVRHMARKNLESINSGNGRVWIYIGKVTVPTCYQLVFPLFVILNNDKMRKSLLRDFKENMGWKNILSFSNFVQKNNFFL